MPLSFKQLCELFDVKQSAALKRVLKKRGVSYILDRKGHPTTTEAALDRALQADKRKINFTKPPACKNNWKKDRYHPAFVKNTGRGTTSTSTNGRSYAE